MATEYRRSCRACGWSGSYACKGRADYAKRIHSCAKQLAKAAARARREAKMAAVDRTPQPCLHPVAEHQHGTHACYALDRCRCVACSKAATAYERNRNRQHAYGRWDNMVDAEPVREHVKALQATGMGFRLIAERAGVAPSGVGKLLWGHKGRPPSMRVRKETADRLLAVTPELRDGVCIDAAETARKLQALVAIGWSGSQLAQRLGVLPTSITPLLHGRRQVTIKTAKAVHALYCELATRRPPETNQRQKIAAARSRNRAKAEGWARPLLIGGRLHQGPLMSTPETGAEAVVPDADQPYDIVAIERRLAGDRSIRLRQGDVARAYSVGVARGISTKFLEDVCGLNGGRRRVS